MRVFFLIMLGSFVIATNSNAQDAIKIARSTKVTSDSTTASQKTSPVVGQKPEVVLSPQEQRIQELEARLNDASSRLGVPLIRIGFGIKAILPADKGRRAASTGQHKNTTTPHLSHCAGVAPCRGIRSAGRAARGAGAD